MTPGTKETIRRWIGRLTFSFVIIAAAMAWEGYKALGTEGRPQRPARAMGCFIAAGASMALASAGMRERHRRD
jgi:hypothetical protein